MKQQGMRPVYQPQSYQPRTATDQANSTQPFMRSPQTKTQAFYPQQSHALHAQQWPGDSNFNPKKTGGNMRHIDDKMEGVEAIMQKKNLKLDHSQSHAYKSGHMSLKNQSCKDLNSFHTSKNSTTNEFSPRTTGQFQTLKREESQPDLRTSCPNIFRKFDQNGSNLRNTTNNLTKFGAILADIKKQDEEEEKEKEKEKKNMKKNGVHYNEPMTPVYKPAEKQYSIMNSQTTFLKKMNTQNKTNFKSLNQSWSNKINSSANKTKNTIINGFDISKQLGKGKFGQVYLGRHVTTGFIVALKKIVKSKVIEYKMVEQFKSQIKLHSALDHPNIVKFYGFFEDGDNIYLILEYISGGTLFDYLAEKQTLGVKEAAEYLRDTIEALTHMHQRSIAHRDIKPENIVLTGEKVAKLCDFGWSALVQSSRTTYCGTFDYAPPEILQRKNYDTAVDIWCIGVLTYQILTGKVPFQGQKRKQIMDKILSVDKTKIVYPVEIPEDARNFIQSLVQKDPNLRPKCKDLLKHPFFVNNLKPVPKDKKI